MSLPIWIYFVIAGIFVSAFMAVKAAREDREYDSAWIEKEGEIYMERIRAEKEKKINKA